MPFFIGPTQTPHNPPQIPDELDFEFEFDEDLGLVRQVLSYETSKLLESAYLLGNIIGNPLTNDHLGKVYSDDFIRIIQERFKGNLQEKKALEIGAGLGYLTSRISDLGFDAIGIEPGKSYSNSWSELGISVVNDFFPSSQIQDHFDLICAYMVLEHVNDPLKFLNGIIDHLKINGVAILAVPDCTEELTFGDPSILLHEHVTYFDSNSLLHLAQLLNVEAEVVKSKYGRSLYLIITNQRLLIKSKKQPTDPKLLNFPSRVHDNVIAVKEQLSQLQKLGTLGIYCPARGLHLIDKSFDLRFFDDDPKQEGKFIPPFKWRIESRQDLISNPVERILIMSRTFGSLIENSLRTNGFVGEVHQIAQLFKAT